VALTGLTLADINRDGDGEEKLKDILFLYRQHLPIYSGWMLKVSALLGPYASAVRLPSQNFGN